LKAIQKRSGGNTSVSVDLNQDWKSKLAIDFHIQKNHDTEKES
jgi:hypothetical protein